MSKLILGLTGGIASGKTAVSNRLAELGAEIIDTDLIARELVEPGSPVLTEVAKHFGSAILTPQGELDRKKLRARVFDHPEERLWLENLMHPRIREVAAERAEASQAKLVVVVVPLLFESGAYDFADLNLVVDLPEPDQIKRLCARDSISEDQAKQILSAQMPREERLKRADRVITNSGKPSDLIDQVDRLCNELVKGKH